MQYLYPRNVYVHSIRHWLPLSRWWRWLIQGSGNRLTTCSLHLGAMVLHLQQIPNSDCFLYSFSFNINLDTYNLEIGKKIVKAVRSATGGYSCIRAIALELEEKKQIQVSMNMINYEKTPIHRVFETIKSEANRYNINVVDTELVGPVPIYALRDVLDFYLRISDSFSVEQIYF